MGRPLSTPRAETIVGARIELRPWRVDDAQWYVDARDDEVFAWTTEQRSTTVADVVHAIRRVETSDEEVAFAIWTRDGRLVGNLAFAITDSVAEVSYFLGPTGRGNGYASDAVRLGCSWLVRSTGIDRVIALTAPGNEASEGVLERADFERSGHRDHPVLGAASCWRLAT